MNKTIIVFALTALMVAPLHLADAQQPGKVFRIGFLRSERPGDAGGQALIDAFRQGLRELGYVEGKNFALEIRWSEGKADRVPEIISEFVRLKVDFIVIGGTTATRAAKKATSTIPIIMGNVDDPVRDGFVASLARPGGNITGLSAIHGELSGKQLELLKETVPKASRVAVLWNVTNPARALAFQETQVAAGPLGVALQSLEVRAASDFESAFRDASRERAHALIVFADRLTNAHRTQIVELAAKNRLPAMYTEQEFVVQAGGLMTYGASFPALYRRAATYVDKILKGAKPADLPVERPIKFELIINLKAAKQIGVTIPPEVLYRADKVIR